jgi:hypothetical protein
MKNAINFQVRKSRYSNSCGAKKRRTDGYPGKTTAIWALSPEAFGNAGKFLLFCAGFDGEIRLMSKPSTVNRLP